MQIRTGLIDVAVVEAHSKASDVVTLDGVIEHALDPIWNKPLGAHPFVVAGLGADADPPGPPPAPKAVAAGVGENPGKALGEPPAAHGVGGGGGGGGRGSGQ